MEDNAISHIRIRVKRAGRRINDGGGGSGRTLCGAFITAYDMMWQDASRSMKDPEWVKRLCPKCLEKAKLSPRGHQARSVKIGPLPGEGE